MHSGHADDRRGAYRPGERQSVALGLELLRVVRLGRREGRLEAGRAVPADRERPDGRLEREARHEVHALRGDLQLALAGDAGLGLQLRDAVGRALLVRVFHLVRLDLPARLAGAGPARGGGEVEAEAGLVVDAEG